MSSDSMLKGTSTLLRDYGWTIVIAVSFALMIRFFVIEAYRIPTPNMRPTLEPGDTVFVTKWPFGIRLPKMETTVTAPRLPKRGEVVVYAQPGDPPRDSIRRVIGLPGDNFQIHRGSVILNGKDLKAPVSSPNANCETEELEATRYTVCMEPPAMEEVPIQKIPADHILVMGDFRVQFTDTATRQKNWHIVPLNNLRALAKWTWLSIEPPGQGARASWFSRIRFERMFKEIH